MMTEDFLEYVDNIQKEYCEKHEIRNRNFICYLELKSIDILTHEKFYVAKSRKSRLLIHHNNIWVDLTDYDIIDIICSFDKELVLKIVDRFKAGYNKEWTDFEFEIQGKRFRGKGINYKDFDLDKEVCLEADFEIRFGDFLFLMNMILFKDIVGQKYVEKEQKIALIRKTLIKYITLIAYYKFNDSQAKSYLDGIEYPIYDRGHILEYKMKVRKYDRYFQMLDIEKILSL